MPVRDDGFQNEARARLTAIREDNKALLASLKQLEAAYNQSTKDHEVCKTSHAPGAGRALLPENGSWRQRLMCVPP